MTASGPKLLFVQFAASGTAGSKLPFAVMGTKVCYADKGAVRCMTALAG